MDTLTIHVPLLNEGVDVSRPTESMVFGEGYYKILPTPNYQASDEEWKFLPGTIVKGVLRREGAGESLYAISKLELSPEEIEWLSFAEESEHDLWEIRNHLREKLIQDTFIDLIKKKLIQLRKNMDILSESESLEAIQNLQTNSEPKIEIVISPVGKLIYFENPDIKHYFESRGKR